MPVTGVRVPVSVQLPPTFIISLFNLMVPELTTAPVEVDAPPVLKVPVLVKEVMVIAPVADPKLPALVTPAMAIVPAVDVTVVPEPIVEAPVTVRARAADESVPPPMVVSAPPTVAAFVMIVAVPADFLTLRL